jgi:hypothetical protein
MLRGIKERAERLVTAEPKRQPAGAERVGTP